MRAWKDWMAENGIVGHGGRDKADGSTEWALEIPDNPQISVNMKVTLPDGRTVTWGGSNMEGTYKLVKEPAKEQ